MVKLALDRLPSGEKRCSQSTISRLENMPDIRALLRQSINPANLIAENKERAAELYRGQLVEHAGRLFDESYSRYHGLGELLESNDPRDRYKAALTLEMMAKTESYIENIKQIHGEAVVSTSLGALTPRVMDVIRIFYPNQIATEL